MSEEARHYEELEAGAEFLAEISATAGERIEHLRMAGVYRVRALEAGGAANGATSH